MKALIERGRAQRYAYITFTTGLGQMDPDTSLTDFRMRDGSRNFLTLPILKSPGQLWRSLRRLKHVKRKANVQSVTDAWITFSWRGWEIAIHDPYGEYWFFAEDPQTPDDVLEEIRQHFLKAGL
tara:strand:- start:2771 stop:3142 length:372 start_codon:yes stop_codon:yes gene_type:complete